MNRKPELGSRSGYSSPDLQKARSDKPKGGAGLSILAAAAVTVLLTACGGGGGGGGGTPSFTATANLNGLQPGKTVSLALNGSIIDLTAPVGAAADPNARYSGSFPRIAQGTVYELTVAQHPLNQMCLVRNGSGTVTANFTVTVDCHVNVLNDSGEIAAVGNLGDSEDYREGRDSVRDRLTKAVTGGGRAGFDFTRVCANGAVEGELDGVGVVLCPDNLNANPAVSVGLGPTQWACTRDNVTGLVWLIAPHDPATVFPPGLCGDGVTWTGGAPGLVASVSELLSIADLGSFSGAENNFVIDRDYFPGIGAGFVKFYTRDANADGLAVPLGPDPRVFAVSFQRLAGQFLVEACNAGVCGALPNLHVGYLASARIDDPLVLTPQAGDTFVDSARELQWHFRAPLITTYAALQAELDAVNASAQGGFSDWRIPNIKELNTLLERERCGPGVGVKCTSLDAAIVTRQGYWSNTSNPVDTGFVLFADFGDGETKPWGRAADAAGVYDLGAVFVRNITWQPPAVP